ncbi:hypothetical protein [Tahibacter caeni]|uniref:hypothetical protein n=1 Tax=Tahibacter caeni TaxID=1453545 RepID=UPI0021491076|nr:hypothetical protein [Tahibacter caeni]
MALSTQEMLLALRAPNAHWLAALVSALDEALKDPEFGPEHRAMLQQLLTAGIVPGSVARASELRFARFEDSFANLVPGDDVAGAETAPGPATAPARPKLTLVGSKHFAA